MKNLFGKVVVITGAAGGLGKALATEFYRLGCHLALIDIDATGLEQLKRTLEPGERNISIHACDVSSEEDIVSCSKTILDYHNGLDILINNAGISMSQLFKDLDLADFRQLMEINFWGTVCCTKYFLPDLLKSQNARLVNVISDFALTGFPGKTAYGSTKSAVMGFTNALKTELAGTSVAVCLVIPPPMDTGLVRKGTHIDESKKAKEIEFMVRHGMPLDRAARRIVRQIRRGKFRIVVGSMMYWIDAMCRLFPTATHHMIGKRRKRFDFV